jgi:hypothetical protein
MSRLWRERKAASLPMGVAADGGVCSASAAGDPCCSVRLDGEAALPAADGGVVCALAAAWPGTSRKFSSAWCALCPENC